MTCWAILSGIEGNLAAYEAVLADIKRQRQPVEELYVLGDVIAAISESAKVIQRLRSPRANEPAPQVCQGWWEEQLLILHGLGRTGEPTELIERYGMDMVKTLWEAIPREMVEWVRALDFGFFELDCLLIHGSSVGVSDELTPDTPPIQMLDRLMRMDANTLFCGRSGLTFQYANSTLKCNTSKSFHRGAQEDNLMFTTTAGGTFVSYAPTLAQMSV